MGPFLVKLECFVVGWIFSMSLGGNDFPPRAFQQTPGGRLCLFQMAQAETLLTNDQAEATPGVLAWAFCGKSNVNTSGSDPVFSITTPPFANAAWVINPISG